MACFCRVIETRVEVWENEKCCGIKSLGGVFPQLFRILPNFHKFFYNSIETVRTCFLFLLENTARKKGKQLLDLDHQNVNSLSPVPNPETRSRFPAEFYLALSEACSVDLFICSFRLIEN